MTNREAHEKAAGMALDESFFRFNGINPDAECIESKNEKKYMIYATSNDNDSNIVVECADIDDMTDYANALLTDGYKELRLLVEDVEV